MDERLKALLDESRSVVFFGGAGVSTESGIPDFRSESGLYHAKAAYGYAPEEMLSHSFFMQRQKIFFDYYRKNLIHPEAEPNAAHLALARLEAAGKVKAVVTQNIDGLHQKAGSRTVFELHGSVLRNYCMKCRCFHTLAEVLDQSTWDEDGVPRCKRCGGVVKPDVVLYEEALDETCLEGAVRAIAAADMLIIGGTSLAVYPAAGLIRYFNGRHLVLINKSETPYDDQADLVIHEAIGRVMEMPDAAGEEGA